MYKMDRRTVIFKKISVPNLSAGRKYKLGTPLLYCKVHLYVPYKL